MKNPVILLAALVGVFTMVACDDTTDTVDADGLNNANDSTLVEDVVVDTLSVTEIDTATVAEVSPQE